MSGSRLQRLALTLGLCLAIGSVARQSSAQSTAAARDALRSHPCATTITTILDRWHARLDSARAADAGPNAPTVTLPTDRLGAWVVLRLGAETAAPVGSATLVEPGRRTRRRWNGRCEEAAPVGERSAPEDEAQKNGFTDDDLQQTLRRLDTGVIFLWSPHMPLSVSGYDSISAAADRLGLPLVPLLDPMADAGYAATTATAAGIPEVALRPLASIELTFRNLTTHAPSIQLFAGGRLLDAMLPGYRDAEYYGDYIAERLAAPRD